MTTVLEPVRERFAELVASMSARDRSLLVGLLAFLVIAVGGGAWWLGRSALGDVRSRISQREDTVALLNGLASDNEEAAAQVKSIEDELRKSAGQDLPSFVEKAAEKTGISANLQGVREKQVSTEGTLEEKTYTVEVTKISLQQLTDFLYEVETGGYPLKVRSMKTKAITASGVKVLNVSMEVSAFRLLEAAAPAAPEAAPETTP
jgi:type II secretory pathway component PulM